MSNPTAFSSVKLPAALVSQAREAAQPMRRSVASQIEYWATLGQVVEHTGLSAQEAQTAIEGYEQAARAKRQSQTLDELETRFAAAEQSGSLAARVRDVVLENKAGAQGARRVRKTA
ncbi:ParD-like family protein [Variovorax terrae]|uniref:ParD-like family protein n=1 Tax=Variovorax terrae TaxID=2923278 RepID=A0A9X1VYL0_9BURK|nr:ParD-like family protein [Variovorax terrae]MCJ0765745.1 ParD-like family protein [Variovorax terrae]